MQFSKAVEWHTQTPNGRVWVFSTTSPRGTVMAVDTLGNATINGKPAFAIAHNNFFHKAIKREFKL